jgi:hypothetical protein
MQKMKNMPIRMSIMMSYVLKVNEKNGCERMFVSNKGGCILEIRNVNIEGESLRLCKITNIATIVFTTNR